MLVDRGVRLDDGYHLSLSFGRALWEDLLRAALPVGIAGGEFDLTRNARGLVRRLEVRQRIAGLLEDRRTPRMLVRAKDRVRGAWKQRREIVYQRVNDLIRVPRSARTREEHHGHEPEHQRQTRFPCFRLEPHNAPFDVRPSTLSITRFISR